MIKSFTVKGYKKLNHFELRDLSRINLITGESDLGKSCILESLFAFCSGNDVNMREGDADKILDTFANTNQI